MYSLPAPQKIIHDVCVFKKANRKAAAQENLNLHAK